MQIGIGLPSAIRGVESGLILDWAKRADAGPFSSLGTIDRVVYPSFEPLVSLAAVAAVTQRIGLMTTVLLAPTRNVGILAKQAATLDALSGGRLTLGLGVGRREDDFRAAPASFRTRGRRFEEQLGILRRVWAGESPVEGVGPVGPAPAQPGGPRVLIGGRAPEALDRAGRLGDGYISGGLADPSAIQQLFSTVQESWKAAGKSGRPRLVGGVYCAIGANAAERGGAYIRDYYGFQGAAADAMAKGLPSTAEAIKVLLQALADVGMDEVILWPTIAGIDQVDRLADLVG